MRSTVFEGSRAEVSQSSKSRCRAQFKLAVPLLITIAAMEKFFAKTLPTLTLQSFETKLRIPAYRVGDLEMAEYPFEHLAFTH